MAKNAIIILQESVFPKGGNTTEENLSLILSRYAIKQTLKSGKDTAVYMAEHPSINKTLVIKRLQSSDLSSERFYRETNILKHLKHPHIPLLYDILKDEYYYYIIEEHIKGESLKSVIESQKLSFNTAVRYAIQLCDILKYLHEHPQGTILYLDLRPDNIIISNGTVNLIDFGSSMFLKDTAKNRAQYGSIGYAAPEQYKKEGSLSPAADIYGIGALLYYMLTGKPPLSDNDFCKKNFPKKLAAIIKKCLHHQPERRYRNINELSEALKQFINRTKNISKSENTSLVISIAGTDRRVGVTHLSMSLTLLLKKKGYQCLLKEQCVPGILFKLLESDEIQNIRTKDGIFEYRGLYISPLYNETIADAKYHTITINDYGVLSSENIDNFTKSDVCLLIGSGKAWEFSDLLKLSCLCDSEKTIFIINNVEGSAFYRLTRSQRSFFMRMPHYDNWHFPGKVGKKFLEQLFDEIKKRWKE